MEIKSAPRTYWIDALKAIGIIFVVIGHTNGIGKFLDIYIFSFHMPLFFFVSGLLIKESELQKKFGLFLQKNFKSLLVPYLFFGLLSYIPWVLFTRHFGSDASLDISPIKPLVGMMYGIGVDGWLQHNAMLWFFPCLFVAHGIFYWIFKLQDGKRLMAILTSGVIGYLISISSMPRLPWGVDIALCAMVFYGAGFLSKNFLVGLRLNILPTVVFALLFFAIQLIAMTFNGRVDMNSHYYGNPVLFYFAAISGIAFWVMICKKLPTINWLARIGAETIVIFPLHRVVFSFITGGAVFVWHIQGDFKSYFVTSMIYTALAIVMLLPVAIFMRKYLPWALGQKKVMLHA